MIFSAARGSLIDGSSKNGRPATNPSISPTLGPSFVLFMLAREASTYGLFISNEVVLPTGSSVQPRLTMSYIAGSNTSLNWSTFLELMIVPSVKPGNVGTPLLYGKNDLSRSASVAAVAIPTAPAVSRATKSAENFVFIIN